jgi:hypothetical protein
VKVFAACKPLAPDVLHIGFAWLNLRAMKFVRPIDFVFLTSLGIFAGSCLVVQATGGVGPCGPASSWGIIWLLGYPVGALGMVVGLVLSLVSAFRKPRRKDTGDTDSN